MSANLDRKTKEFNKWQEVRDFFGDKPITLGPFTAYKLRNTPRNVLFGMSRYKFAAKLFGPDKDVLEIGCSEGLGTVLLAEFAKKVVAIDMDEKAIEHAKISFSSPKIDFRTIDFLKASLGKFDGIASFDVIEHVYPENENKFFLSMTDHLRDDGICIVGTPNKNAEEFASEIARAGHVNLYTWERLQDTLQGNFRQVFIFSSNDEMIHTGFCPLAHYLIGVGVGLKHR